MATAQKAIRFNRKKTKRGQIVFRKTIIVENPFYGFIKRGIQLHATRGWQSHRIDAGDHLYGEFVKQENA